jgi:hypothetical protein
MLVCIYLCATIKLCAASCRHLFDEVHPHLPTVPAPQVIHLSCEDMAACNAHSSYAELKMAALTIQGVFPCGTAAIKWHMEPFAQVRYWPTG